MNKNKHVSQEQFNEAYKKVLLATFKRTIAFLESHQIKWCVCGGTCLGAVRHHNIIPWDDDVDIFVPRDDYERLFAIRQDLVNYQLGMVALEDGNGYYQGMIKIYDDCTTLWEVKEFPQIIGVFIDVFPIEKSNINKDEFIEIQNSFRKARSCYWSGLRVTDFVDFFELFMGLRMKTFKSRLIEQFSCHDRNEEFRRFLCSTRQIPYQANGKFMMCVMGSYGEREYCPSSWFDSTCEMSFSDFKVKMPVGYDNYLRQLYGDYMTLPPMEERKTHHFHYYCNLNERLSMDEARQRISMGEYVVI